MTVQFYKTMGVRAIKTAAQAAAALMGSEAVGITSLDWGQFLSVALGAGLFSILTTLSSLDAPESVTKTGKRRAE